VPQNRRPGPELTENGSHEMQALFPRVAATLLLDAVSSELIA
jgi:hypothetical protein